MRSAAEHGGRPWFGSRTRNCPGWWRKTCCRQRDPAHPRRNGETSPSPGGGSETRRRLGSPSPRACGGIPEADLPRVFGPRVSAGFWPLPVTPEAEKSGGRARRRRRTRTGPIFVRGLVEAQPAVDVGVNQNVGPVGWRVVVHLPAGDLRVRSDRPGAVDCRPGSRGVVAGAVGSVDGQPGGIRPGQQAPQAVSGCSHEDPGNTSSWGTPWSPSTPASRSGHPGGQRAV